MTPSTNERVMIAAARKAAALGIAPGEYLAGILDGRYPNLTHEEVNLAGAGDVGEEPRPDDPSR